MRAGTTWLHEQLAAHPQVCLPRGKETFYLDRHYARGEEWYARHFPERLADARVGEIGASYFHFADAPSRARNVTNASVVIISVRDPVARAWSTYLHYLRRGRASHSLERALREQPAILEGSRYAKHVPRWIDAFGESAVRFLELAEIEQSPERALDRVCGWLDIDATFIPDAIRRGEQVNSTYVPRSRVLQRGKQTLYRFLRGRHMYGVLGALQYVSRELDERAAWLQRRADAPRKMSAAEGTLLQSLLGEDAAFLESVLRNGEARRPGGN